MESRGGIVRFGQENFGRRLGMMEYETNRK